VVLTGIKGAARKRLTSRRFMTRSPFQLCHGQCGDAVVAATPPRKRG
jgi:hypothetical protein